MYVAGNIVGWGGPYSNTFSRTKESGINFFEEQVNELFTQGTGEELAHMTPEELRVAINKYLDKGVDFIKYGGTEHNEYPTLIQFSPRAQQVIVDETHKRGLFAETHSTTLEGLYLSIMAGLDVIQHPEVLGFREITDELLDLIVQRKIICSMSPTVPPGSSGRITSRNVSARALNQRAGLRRGEAAADPAHFGGDSQKDRRIRLRAGRQPADPELGDASRERPEAHRERRHHLGGCRQRRR